jgi:hypothetical protein
MTLQDFRNKLVILAKELPQEVERICIMQAQSGLTIVKNRSINKGIFLNSDDGNYADYSKRPINTNKFIGKERNASGSQFIKKNRLATWHDFRKAQGLVNEKVNLSYTNRMWSSLAIIKTNRGVGSFSATIGSSDPLVDTYLPKLVKRYGNFINPTIIEASLLKSDSIREIQTYIQRKLS